MEIFDGLQDFILNAADQWWILLVLYAFCTIDGFFPPIPSESIVIALAALAVTGDTVSLWLIVPVAAAGAMTGDLIAFSIGRKIPLRRLRLFRTERGVSTLDWAEDQLRRRGGTFILSARYIPVGRVAVNMTAGAVGFPLRRFLAFDAVAAVMWALYGVAIGTVAGQVLGHNPLLAMAVGIVGGVIIGFGLDKLLSRFGFGPVDLEHDRATTAPVGQAPVGQAPVGQAPVDQAPVGQSESAS